VIKFQIACDSAAVHCFTGGNKSKLLLCWTEHSTLKVWLGVVV